jgi:hypothetical protein
MKTVQLYLSHDAMTHSGSLAGRLDDLPGKAAALVRMGQGPLIHHMRHRHLLSRLDQITRNTNPSSAAGIPCAAAFCARKPANPVLPG